MSAAAVEVVPPTGEVMLEALRWHPVPGKDLPDDGTTVLVELEGDSQPTWLGWMDGDTWRSVSTGDVFEGTVVGWAHLPAGGRAC